MEQIKNQYQHSLIHINMVVLQLMILIKLIIFMMKECNHLASISARKMLKRSLNKMRSKNIHHQLFKNSNNQMILIYLQHQDQIINRIDIILLLLSNFMKMRHLLQTTTFNLSILRFNGRLILKVNKKMSLQQVLEGCQCTINNNHRLDSPQIVKVSNL